MSRVWFLFGHPVIPLIRVTRCLKECAVSEKLGGDEGKSLLKGIVKSQQEKRQGLGTVWCLGHPLGAGFCVGEVRHRGGSMPLCEVHQKVLKRLQQGGRRRGGSEAITPTGEDQWLVCIRIVHSNPGITTAAVFEEWERQLKMVAQQEPAILLSVIFVKLSAHYVEVSV